MVSQYITTWPVLDFFEEEVRILEMWVKKVGGNRGVRSGRGAGSAGDRGNRVSRGGGGRGREGNRELQREDYVKFKYNIGTKYSVTLASVLGMEHHHLTMSTL